MPSIHDHIKNLVGPTLSDIPSDAAPLPDEERFYVGKDGPRYAPGAIDGIMTHHMARFDRDNKLVEEIADLLSDLAEKLDMETLNELEDKLESIQMILAYIDPIIEQLAARETSYYPNLHQVARQLTIFAKKRNSVKLGLALLRFSDYQEDMEPVFILGLHDEFTVYSMYTFLNYYEDPTIQLFELAKRVHGWGRIHLVEKLAENPELPDDIRDWLLREGFRNTVMNEYLAIVCANAGKLDSALAGKTVDAELMKGAAEILIALFEEGPVAGISMYAQREKVFELFKRQAEQFKKIKEVSEALKKITEYKNSTKID